MTAVLFLLALITPLHLDVPPEVVEPAVATQEATRLDPPPPPPVEATPEFPSGSSVSSGGRCVGWEPLLERYSPGWSVERMSRIAYRESRCLPAVRNPSGASGLLQMMPMHCKWLAGAVGPCDLFDADYNIRASAALWRRQGYSAWSTS